MKGDTRSLDSGSYNLWTWLSLREFTKDYKKAILNPKPLREGTPLSTLNGALVSLILMAAHVSCAFLVVEPSKIIFRIN